MKIKYKIKYLTKYNTYIISKHKFRYKKTARKYCQKLLKNSNIKKCYIFKSKY